jgi:hypothetical protein
MKNSPAGIEKAYFPFSVFPASLSEGIKQLFT